MGGVGINARGFGAVPGPLYGNYEVERFVHTPGLDGQGFMLCLFLRQRARKLVDVINIPIIQPIRVRVANIG